MGGVAGYKAQLKIGGTPVSFINEPLTQLTGNLLLRISDADKRVLSANHPLVISAVDGLDSTQIFPDKVNYLEGVILIKVEDYDPSFTYQIDQGHFIPLSFIGGAKDYNLEIAGDVLDDSAFHSDTTLNPGYRSKVAGIHDISCSFSRWNDFSNNKLKEAKIAKTPIFVSINPGASKTFIKGWFQIETDGLSGDVGSLEQEDLSLVLCGNNSKTYFSYSFNYTDVEAQAMDEEDLIANYFFD